MFLPDRLRAVWEEVSAGRLSRGAAAVEQERQLDAYRTEWSRALLYDGEQNLRTSLLQEVATYYGMTDLAEVEQRCAHAVEMMRHEWEANINPRKRASIESFYQSATMIYDLMGWHSLRD